jgi:predicted permease
MVALLDVALPVFGIILAGYLVGQAEILGEQSSEALNRFVYWVSLPALLFAAMAKAPVADVLNLPFIAAFGGGSAATFLVAILVGRLFFRETPAEQSMQAFCAVFSNTGYMGIPLFLAAWGTERALPAIIGGVFNASVAVGLIVALLEFLLARGKGARKVAADVALALLRNPLIAAPVLGLLVSAAGIALPKPVDNFCGLIGGAAGPCALFALGLFCVGKPLTDNVGEMAWVTLCKLVLQPLATWVLAVPVLGMDRFWAGSCVLLAALPTGALAFTLAQNYGVYVRRASTATLVTTVISVLTVSAVLLLVPPV